MEKLTHISSVVQRLELLANIRVLTAFLFVYAGLLVAESLIRYRDLIESVFLFKENGALAQVVFLVVRNIIPNEQTGLWLTISALISFNLVLIGLYIHRARELFSPRNIGFGVGGIGAFLFGIGCFSCGTIIGTFIASVMGAGFISFFAGAVSVVLAWVGAGGLLVLTGFLVKKVTDPFVC